MAREANAVVRPWVTYGWLAVILGVWLSFQLSGTGNRDAAALAVDEAVDFYADNPAVELDGRLRPITDTERFDEITASHAELKASRGYRRMPERLRAQTQAKFDARVDAAVEAYLAANPGWKYGLTGRDDEPERFGFHAFVHESGLALMVGVLFLALGGIVLESTLGAVFFGLFTLLSAALTAGVFVTLHSGLAVPWSGTCGVLAGVMGLYLSLAFRASPMPGWLVVPLWLFAENLLVRGGWGGGVDSLPWVAQAAGLGFGVAVGLVLPRVRVHVAAESEQSDDERRRTVLGRATRLRGEGEAMEALAVLREELERSKGDPAVTRALWELSVDCVDAPNAAPAMVELIRREVKRGELELALEDWRNLTGSFPEAELPPQILIRLGEASLDAGRPDDAMRAMARSLEATPRPSSALALRILNVARDLDSGIARRAAAIALTDAQLDPTLVEELRELSAGISPTGEPAEPTLQAPQPLDLSTSAESLHGAVDLPESDLQAIEDLDPHAVNPDALQESFNEDLPEDLLMDSGSDADTLVDSLDPHALSSESLSREAGDSPLDALVEDLSLQIPDDPMALGDELLESAPVGDPLEDSAATDAMTAPTHTVDSSPAADGDPLADTSSDTQTQAVGLADTDVEVPDQLRPIKVVPAVPVALERGGVTIEASGRGKSRIPYERIQAVAVAAVAGIASRPVIVIDVVLNWLHPEDALLRVIRMRSDEFQPTNLIHGAESALDAMRLFLQDMLSNSNAIPLPDNDAARGDPFTSYRSLALYESKVLGGQGD